MLVVSLSVLGCANPPTKQLVLWHALEGRQARALEQLVDRWNAQAWQHGAVIVVERHAPAQLEARFRLANGADAESAPLPDLALLPAHLAALSFERGLLHDLGPLIDSADVEVGWNLDERSQLFPFMLSAGRDQRGALIGVPHGGVLRLLLVNLRAFVGDAAPSELVIGDWPALQRTCTSAFERGVAACISARLDGTLVEEWLIAHGALAFDAASGQVLLETPAARTALEDLAQSVNEGIVVGAFSPQQQFADFAEGRHAAMLIWSSDVQAALSTARLQAAIPLAVQPLPGLSRPTVQYRAPLWVAPRAPREQVRLAWLFIRWLTKPEQTQFWHQQTGELPARLVDVRDDAAVSPALRQQTLLQLARLAQPEPLHPNRPCAQAIFGEVAQRLLDRQPVTTTLEAVQAKAKRFGPCVPPR
ncbi:MAG: extracellular solute-binding protein [Thermoflexales bacterium]